MVGVQDSAAGVYVDCGQRAGQVGAYWVTRKAQQPSGGEAFAQALVNSIRFYHHGMIMLKNASPGG
jgi:hypothetical protein